MPFIIFAIIFLIVFFAITSKRKYFNREKYIKEKGEDGEIFVSQILGHSIDGVQQVFNDYRFISSKKSVQVDHIFINRNGVFIIETKNYKGMIYGTDEQQEWTQVLSYGNVKNKFYNPIKQNKSHIYKLSKILPKEVEMISVVVFIEADIDNVVSDNVCKLNELKRILKLDFGTQLTPQQIDYYANILRKHQNNNITDEEHIADINKMREDIENNICPRCGAKLVIRTGDYGEFYGCSNYPKCKFKKKV